MYHMLNGSMYQWDNKFWRAVIFILISDKGENSVFMMFISVIYSNLGPPNICNWLER